MGEQDSYNLEHRIGLEMFMMGQEYWGHIEKGFDGQPQMHGLYPVCCWGGTITREVGQAAGLGQLIDELMINSPKYKSQRGAAPTQEKGTPFLIYIKTHIGKRIPVTHVCSWIQLMFLEHALWFRHHSGAWELIGK